MTPLDLPGLLIIGTINLVAAGIVLVLGWLALIVCISIALCANHDPEQARREGRLW